MATNTPRRYPLRKPPNHQLPMPRWQLRFDESTVHVFTAYLGVQLHAGHVACGINATTITEAVTHWLRSKDHPLSIETFTTVDNAEGSSAIVWVCYWDDAAKGRASLAALDLRRIYYDQDARCRASVGIWCESFSSAVSRLETNYSGIDYLPGLAQLPQTHVAEHSLSAYWGAARDRIPDSANDKFPQTVDLKASNPMTVPRGLGQHLVGSSFSNLVHIRTGQFWKSCDDPEREAYESKLEPTLRAGLAYLRENPVASGAYGLRYLRNTGMDNTTGDRRETCVTGYFRNLEDLEAWSKSHRSHLAIYTGAIKHAKAFGDERKFRTWHEVSVLQEGEAKFEYINCLPSTGVISHIALSCVAEIECHD